MIIESAWSMTLLASSIGVLLAFARTTSFTVVASRNLQTGAVGETRMRIPPNQVAGFLQGYAQWFLPVDEWSDPEQGLTSGRDLLTMLLREYGDEYNVVLVHRYEDRFKTNYYLKYARAFVEVHGATLFPDRVEEFRAKLEQGEIPEEVSAAIREKDVDLFAVVEASASTWNLEAEMSSFGETASASA